MFICPKLQGLATVVSEPPDFVQKIAFIFNLSDLEILDGGLWSVTGHYHIQRETNALIDCFSYNYISYALKLKTVL